MAKAKQLPSGQWRTLVYSHTDIVNGKKVRRYESFTADTKKESEFLAAQFALTKSNLEKPINLTLSEAIDCYIKEGKNVLSPTTIQGYKTIKRNAFPSIMDINLKRINNNVLRQAISDEVIRPSKRFKDNKHRLSPKTIKNNYGLIVSVLKRYNPNIDVSVKLPKLENKIIELIPPEKILEVIKDTEIELPVLLAMWLSFSMSEIRGISKSKSIKNGYITIEQVMVNVDNKPLLKSQTKAFKRVRKLRIPPYIQGLIDKTDPDEDMLITMSSHAIYSRFTRLLKKNNLPHMTFHNLRHENASIMALLQIPDKYAKERGGWKTDEVMKKVYQHTFSADRVLVDDKIDSFFEKMQHEMQHKK